MGNPVELDAGRLIDLAVRLPAYAGVVAARARWEEQQAESGVRDSGSASLAADPIFGEFVDMTVVQEGGFDG